MTTESERDSDCGSTTAAGADCGAAMERVVGKVAAKSTSIIGWLRAVERDSSMLSCSAMWRNEDEPLEEEEEAVAEERMAACCCSCSVRA